MDPNIHSEQTGLAEDHSQAGDTAAYLRRLKAQPAVDTVSAPTDAGNANAPAVQPFPAAKERRRSPRFSCSGSVELLVEGSDARLWGTLKDISLHGCYVEMPTTFPANTRTSLTLESAGIRVQTQATVRASYPFLGMGLCYTEMEAGQHSRLEQILTAVAGQRAFFNGAPGEQTGPPEIPASADPSACLQGVAEFFRKNATLSRDEFYQIAKRARRS